MPIPFRSVGDTVLTNQGFPFSDFDLMKSNVPPGVTDIARSFTPFGGAYLADPYSFFSEARAATPVFYHQETNFWAVTRYNDIRQIFQNTKLFSAANALDTPGVCPAAGKIYVDANFNVVPTLTNTDYPHHTRVRRLASSAFTAKRVADIEPFVRELVVRFIDERFSGGQVDLVRALTWDFPALVLFRFLGFPDEDLPAVQAGADNSLIALWGPPSEKDQVGAAQGMAAFWTYTRQLVDKRALEPHDDFATALLEARSADLAPLSPAEASSIIFGLLVAGHETTTALLSNGFRQLLQHRAAWEAIGKDGSLIPNAIEEILRLDSSVIAWRRKTKEPVEIGAVAIPAQADLLLLLGSANRDPAVFDDPDTFNIQRPNARNHVSLGIGNHLCLGAPLARLEARVVFEEFSRRFPSLHLVPGQQLHYQPNTFFRAPVSLLANWDA
jgi:cytochrome P450